MNNQERDKFLTEAMGETWHEWVLPEEHCKHIPGIRYKCKCGGFHPTLKRNNDFSTWAGFGKLWEWAQRQDWWRKCLLGMGDWVEDGTGDMLVALQDEFIHPDRFANIVYEFLRDQK